MTCCEHCPRVLGRTYEVTGDGDGVEFLIETARMVDGDRTTTTVVFRAGSYQDGSWT